MSRNPGFFGSQNQAEFGLSQYLQIDAQLIFHFKGEKNKFKHYEHTFRM